MLALTAAAILAACGPISYPPDPAVLQDALLSARVKTALLNAADVDATKIDVRAAGGAVTLEGEVPTEDEARNAVDVARHVPGVVDVSSKLAISRAPRRTTVPS